MSKVQTVWSIQYCIDYHLTGATVATGMVEVGFTKTPRLRSVANWGGIWPEPTSCLVSLLSGRFADPSHDFLLIPRLEIFLSTQSLFPGSLPRLWPKCECADPEGGGTVGGEMWMDRIFVSMASGGGPGGQGAKSESFSSELPRCLSFSTWKRDIGQNSTQLSLNPKTCFWIFSACLIWWEKVESSSV